MDDTERQSGTPNAEQERQKGAALEYDAEDQDALDSPAASPGRQDTPRREEK